MDISNLDLNVAIKELNLVAKKHVNIHLYQAKIFTLFSICIHFLLKKSHIDKGAYIIRLESSSLLNRLIKGAKTPLSREILYKLSSSRKQYIKDSIFYLDFFQPSSWSLTSNIARERIKYMLIVKDSRAIFTEEDSNSENKSSTLNIDQFINHSPKNLIISVDYKNDNIHPLEFKFLKQTEDVSNGVTICSDIDLSNVD